MMKLSRTIQLFLVALSFFRPAFTDIREHREANNGDRNDGHQGDLIFPAVSSIGRDHMGMLRQDHHGPQQQEKPILNMTLCEDKCYLESNCTSYLSPISECYDSGALFPNDPSWSGKDVLDTVICQTLIRRIFGSSRNGTCVASPSEDDDDRFQIPLNECVGPFGQPRPWGMFQLVMPPSSARAEETADASAVDPC